MKKQVGHHICNSSYKFNRFIKLGKIHNGYNEHNVHYPVVIGKISLTQF